MMIQENQQQLAQPPAAEPMMAPADSGALGLLDLWGLVRRRKGLIAFGLFAGLALGALYFFQATPMYESGVQLLVVQKDPSLPARGVEGGGNFESSAKYEDLLSTHMSLLQSRKIIMDAIDKGDLKSVASIKKQIQEDEDPVEYITDHLEVTKGGEGRAKDAHVLQAVYRDPNPQDAAKILEAIVASYQDFLGETFQDVSEHAYELISQAKTDLEIDLEKLDQDYQRFREEAPLLWDGDKTSNVHRDQLLKIQEQLAEVRQQRSESQARLAVIQEALAKKGPEGASDLDSLSLLSNTEVERLNLLVNAFRDDTMYDKDFQSKQPLRTEAVRTQYERLLSLLLEKEQLMADYGPDHPQVQKAEDQIKLVTDFLAKNEHLLQPKQDEFEISPSDLLTAFTGLLQNDLAELAKRERDLTQQAAEEQAAAKQLVSYELQDESKKKAIERKEKLYDAIVDRLEDIDLVKDYGGFITQVISPIQPSLRPASPKLVLSLGLGGLLGLFFGCGLAYLVDISDKTFRNPDELRAALQSPIIAHVPALVSRRTKQPDLAPTNGDPQIDQMVLCHHRPKSRQAEAFRGMRTALYFSAEGADHKVIQITSPNPGDGKTTICSNLAVSIAQSGKRVILIDCDFRRSKLHKVFDLDSEVGVASVMADEVELADAIQSSAIENLDVLTCGPHPPNPSELLSSRRFDELLGIIRQKYDVAILDTPPLLAVSDPSVVAPRVDGVLMAVRITKNGRPQAMRAKEMLASLGAQMLGVIVNSSDTTHGYGYRDYGYAYGYGYRPAYGYPYGYGPAFSYGYGYGYDDGDKRHNAYYADESKEEAKKA